MLKYRAAATHTALNLLSTVDKPKDELRPFAEAPLTTLLSTMAVIRVGYFRPAHLWASLKREASSSILMWLSLRKLHEASTDQLPERAKSLIAILSRPFDSCMESSCRAFLSAKIQEAKSRAIAWANWSVYVAEALVYLPCTWRCLVVQMQRLSMCCGAGCTHIIRKLLRWGEEKRHESTLTILVQSIFWAAFQERRCFSIEEYVVSNRPATRLTPASRMSWHPRHPSILPVAVFSSPELNPYGASRDLNGGRRMMLNVVHGGSAMIPRIKRLQIKYESQHMTWLSATFSSSEKDNSIGGPVGIPKAWTAAVTLAAPAKTSMKSNRYAIGLAGPDDIASRGDSKSTSSLMPRRFNRTSDGDSSRV